jgi:hypothetical protein
MNVEPWYADVIRESLPMLVFCFVIFVLYKWGE